jgi:hypothetical protein
MNDTARAGEAQVARDDQPKGYGTGQQRQRHPKDQPKGCGAGPRHQQQPQDQRGKRRRPPQKEPARNWTRTRRQPCANKKGRGRAGRRGRRRWPPQNNKKLQQTRATWLGRKRERNQFRAIRTKGHPRWTSGGSWLHYLRARVLGRAAEKNRLIAALSQMMESMDQPAPDLGSSVSAAAVGVLRAEKPKDVSQWRCKVPTCSGSCHPLIKCPAFLQMPAEERGELVALSDLCRGCLTPGHGTMVQACPFRDELDGLCAMPKCKRAHHQLPHVDGKQSRCPHQYLGGDAAMSKQRYAQAAATMAHAVHQPPVQLVTQRIRTASGKSCLAFWDNGSQVTLTTQKAAMVGAGANPGAAP